MARQSDIDQLAINTIRTLAIDAIQKANSGHPGTPMGAAPTAYTLWQDFCVTIPDPGGPIAIASCSPAATPPCCSTPDSSSRRQGRQSRYEQVGRDAVTLDDLKTFRQAGSRCPGHPEYGWTSGVESTTGPLGKACHQRGDGDRRPVAGRTYNRPGTTCSTSTSTRCAATAT